jgi:branched-chain amino acid aminotransferase
MKNIVYHNGTWIEEDLASMNLKSQTIHYGNGVFEGIRSYNGEDGPSIFKAKEHFDRLIYSASVMGISIDLTSDQLTKVAYELIDKNNLTDAYIRPLVYTGIDMGLNACSESYVYMMAWKWENYMEERLQSIMVSSFERPNPKSCIVDAKVTGHYTNSILATAEAKRRGYDSAVLLDMYGNVAEGPGANLFVEKDGILYTPPIGNILPGITRDTVLELSREIGFLVRTESFGPEFLINADNAFFTGTAAEVKGIGYVNDQKLPLPWEESIGYTLSLMYHKLVRNKRYSAITMV